MLNARALFRLSLALCVGVGATGALSGCRQDVDFGEYIGVDGWLDYEGEDADVVEACAEDARPEVELPENFAWARSIAHDITVTSHVDDNRKTQFFIQGALLFDGGDSASYAWTCSASKYLNMVRVHEVDVVPAE